MRGLVIAGSLVGIGIVAARVMGPQMRDRCMAGAERMFEQAPETFPPKRMLRGIEETRANTARILELLEQQQGGVPAA
jgi:hypothetical protein